MPYFCNRCGEQDEFERMAYGNHEFEVMQYLNGNEEIEDEDDREYGNSEIIDVNNEVHCVSCGEEAVWFESEMERQEAINEFYNQLETRAHRAIDNRRRFMNMTIKKPTSISDEQKKQIIEYKQLIKRSSGKTKLAVRKDFIKYLKDNNIPREIV